MYAMNIQNDVIGLVLDENCKSKQVTDFIAWPSRCHDTIHVAWHWSIPNKYSSVEATVLRNIFSMIQIVSFFKFLKNFFFNCNNLW